MIVRAIKTKPFRTGDRLFPVLDSLLTGIKDRDIVIISSKIISLSEGRTVPAESVEKKELVIREAEKYIETQMADRPFAITINHGILIPNAGIDESNGEGNLVLWPENPVKSAVLVWNHLRQIYKLNLSGVIITDSHTTPLRWGTQGIGIGWCGFIPLNDYIGRPDIFGRIMEVTKANILDGLAAAAVAVMGEGSEQTPIAVIRDTPFVTFVERPPSEKEINDMRIPLELDLYAPILSSVSWQKGKINEIK